MEIILEQLLIGSLCVTPINNLPKQPMIGQVHAAAFSNSIVAAGDCDDDDDELS